MNESIQSECNGGFVVIEHATCNIVLKVGSLLFHNASLLHFVLLALQKCHKIPRKTISYVSSSTKGYVYAHCYNMIRLGTTVLRYKYSTW